MMDCLKGLSTSCYASNPTFSLSVLALRHDRFLFLLYCMSSSHSICPLSHSRRRLSLLHCFMNPNGEANQTCTTKDVQQNQADLIRTIKADRDILLNKSIITADHTTDAIHLQSPISALTDQSLINSFDLMCTYKNLKQFVLRCLRC